jgi:hypothetical protein
VIGTVSREQLARALRQPGGASSTVLAAA